MAGTPDDPSRATRPPRRRPAPDAFGRRPLIERLGLAVIALGLGALFAVVGIASFVGGEPFLGVMGADRLPDGAVGRRADAVPRLTGRPRRLNVLARLDAHME